MMMTWLDEAKAEGRKEGQKDLIVQLLTERFGPLPSQIRRRIAAIRSVHRLRELATQVVQVRSLQELTLE